MNLPSTFYVVEPTDPADLLLWLAAAAALLTYEDVDSCSTDIHSYLVHAVRRGALLPAPPFYDRTVPQRIVVSLLGYMGIL